MSAPDFRKTHYIVAWAIDEWADSPREAAELALADMPTKDNLTTAIFGVERCDQTVEIDLDETCPDHDPNSGPGSDQCTTCGQSNVHL